MKDSKKVLTTNKAPQAIGPYSQGIAFGEWIFISGQIPLDPVAGVLVTGGIKEQMEQALKNIGAVLNEGHATFQEVVKTTVYLKDLSNFDEMNGVYGRYFQSPYPARATIQAAALPKGALVEIDAIAMRRDLQDHLPL